jgi:hypothetical protein
MDTGAILYNLRKFTFLIVITLLIFLITGCPGEEDCFDLGSTTRENDLINLLPEQTEYNQGDLVILSLNLPSTNSYFGNELDLFQETGDDLARLRLGSFDLFTDNEVDFITGSQADNRFFMPYNYDNNTYELKIEIILNKAGNYSFVTDETIEIIGNGCDRYIIDTNISWQGDAVIEFSVNE